MPTEIEFGSRDAANQIRNNSQYRGFLDESDDARQATVRLKDGTPEPALNDITGEAADSKRQESEKAGQVKLTDGERNRIDFTRPGMNVMKARSIKGVAIQEGVGDWIQHADFTLSVDENRRIMKQAKREGGGPRGGRDLESDQEVDRRLASAHHERQRNELGRAKRFAIVDADSDAQEFLSDQGSIDDVFDTPAGETKQVIKRAFGCAPLAGSDYDLVKERHENRSERAKSIDEQRDAELTCDPVTWTNQPNRYDYPGVDTTPTFPQKDEPVPGISTGSPADVPETPSPERNTDAPEPFTAQLAQQDVSLSPEEAFEGVGSGSAEMSQSRTPFGLAGGDEADMAFVQAEEERASAGPEPSMPGFTDDRDREGQLTDFGMETDATQHRESRPAEEQASVFGIDDREEATRGAEKDRDSGKQQGFEVFGGGVRENETLF